MLRATAGAKLNLYLHLTGKRDDGYHLLDSLVCFLAIGDTITVAAAEELSLSIEGEFSTTLQANDNNLVMRAAKALQSYTGTTQGAAITLHKHLPVAAGLGGGSSDAATAAKLLRALWGVAVSQEALTQLLLPLGADMAVCVHGGPAFMSGIGERIEPLPSLPALPILLVNPRVELSTAAVYQAYHNIGRWMGRPSLDFSSAEALCVGLAGARNNLQQPAISLCAAVADVLLTLETQMGVHFARLCGSGATCFGVFDSRASLERAAETIRRDQPDWWVAPTMSLSKLDERPCLYS